ncbi:MAG: hypothetical protein M5U01_34770 [Ardenticatenaceae bacterium]|nr:hypothetical protein [Ardenticatenaceae bacterium]
MALMFPEIEAALDREQAVGHKNNVAVRTGASTPDQLRQQQTPGFTFLGYGPDYA